MDGESVAGDYQCLAYYGVCAVASIPWRVTISRLESFSKQENVDIQVTEGNTLSWRCIPPISNPDPYINYFKNGAYISSDISESQSLILQKVEWNDSGSYSCSVSNTLKKSNTSAYLNLIVERYGVENAPYFIMEPRASYVVVKGKIQLELIMRTITLFFAFHVPKPLLILSLLSFKLFLFTVV